MGRSIIQDDESTRVLVNIQIDNLDVVIPSGSYLSFLGLWRPFVICPKSLQIFVGGFRISGTLAIGNAGAIALWL